MNKLSHRHVCFSLFIGFIFSTGLVSCYSDLNSELSKDGKSPVVIRSQQTFSPIPYAQEATGGDDEGSAGESFSFTLNSGKLKVFMNDRHGSSVLIRNRTDPRQKLSKQDQAEIIAEEFKTARRWLKSKSRFKIKPPQTPLETHDALLEVAVRLEPLHEEDPEHLGILRDLLEVYSQLLAFERETDLGSNLCVLVSDKLVTFERLAAPLDSYNRQQVIRTRAWLHYAMHHYPTAATSQETAIRKALSVLDQQYFETLPAFSIGRLRANVFSTVGSSPDPDLLWDVYHILVGYPHEKNPARIVDYTLCSQGDEKNRRWYLMGHVLNRSTLIRLFGTQRPEFQEIKSLVTQHALSMQTDSANENTAEERRNR